jgi:uncharacterized membrane protein YfcA
MTWQLVLAGLAVGTLVGFTGMGGGSLLAPVLILLLGFNPTVAIGTDLLHGAVFKSVGALRHRALGTVQARLSAWMFAGSAPTSILGVVAATWLRHRSGHAMQIQEWILGGVLILGAGGMLAKSAIRFREAPDTPFVLTRRDRIAAVLIGLCGGFIVGLTSVGSGVFFGLTLLFVFPLRSAKVVGTDMLHAAALLWVAGFGHFIAGNVDISAVAWLLVGSVPGVLVGSQFTVRVADRQLRFLMAGVLAASGVELLKLPGANEIAVAAVIGVLAVAAVTESRRRLARLASEAALDLELEPVVGALDAVG